jgi:hypothetical protein
MSNKENVKIISARPEDADFIAWIVAQGMHMDGVPSFLKKHGARENTLYSWQNTRLLRCEDGKLNPGEAVTKLLQRHKDKFSWGYEKLFDLKEINKRDIKYDVTFDLVDVYIVLDI